MLFAIVHLVLVCDVRAGGGFDTGRESADTAAAPDLRTGPPVSLRGWSYGYAFADTTGYDFPEDTDEKSTMQLAKEVTLWLIVAGFVAYFIVQVFFEPEDQQTDTPPPGKPDPTGSAIEMPPATAPL